MWLTQYFNVYSVFFTTNVYPLKLKKAAQQGLGDRDKKLYSNFAFKILL